MLHGVCTGLASWPLGPFHCPNCKKTFASHGLHDITLDNKLLHVVCGGDPAELSEVDRERCERVATWWRWIDGQLWTGVGRHRRVPPIAERATLVRRASE